MISNRSTNALRILEFLKNKKIECQKNVDDKVDILNNTIKIKNGTV